MKIIRPATAGSLESNDCLITVDEGAGTVQISVESIVMRQFGADIERSVREVLSDLNVTDAIVRVQDKGAVDCALRARVECAVLRGAKE